MKKSFVMSRQPLVSNGPEETKAVAAELAKTLKGGEVIALIGDLGAGKTTFTQGLVAALGSSARVKSPTFTVMNEYKVDQEGGVINPALSRINRIVHIDFYRFSEEKELGALSLEDEKRPDTVIIAEWPNVFPEGVFAADITVFLEHEEGDARSVVLQRG